MNEGGFRERYIDSLRGLSKDENRAALAALRRGLGADNGVAPEMHRYVVPWLSEQADPSRDAALYQVAALYAWHQDVGGVMSDPRHNFGRSCLRLARKVGRDSLENRFVALLNSHPDDLYPRLRNMTGLLRSNQVPVNWVRLLRDIQGWGWESRSVQRAWARAYWAAGSARDDDDGESSDDQSENQ